MPPRRNHKSRAALRHARLVAAGRAGDVREAAQLIQLLARLNAEPLAQREKITTWIATTAEQLEFDRTRAEAIWWKEARRVDAWEMDALRAAVRTRLRRAPR
jgi:hypothetical protein